MVEIEINSKTNKERDRGTDSQGETKREREKNE